MKLTIKLPPRTKKNSQRIVLVKGRPVIIQSKQYKDYEKAASIFIPKTDKPIDYPVNVKMLFYTQTRRRCDLVNHEEACLDILTKYGLLQDDNSNIVVSMDGSRVLYDKDNSRTEVEITKLAEEI